MLSVENLTVRFAERPVLDGITFRVSEGQRVAVAGRNGQGKSTLFRVLMGEQAPEKGKVELDRGRKAGYLPQDIAPPDTDRTVIEEVLDAVAEVKKLEAEVERLTCALAEDPENEKVLAEYGRAQARFEALGGYEVDARARTILDGLGFSQARMDGPMRQLSGGWLMRVQLARLLLERPDLLILDEPTNHLDIEAREWLLEYLKGFEGAVLLTSHDRYFLDALVDRILELELGRLEVYHGNYTYFEGEKVVRRERLKSSYERQQKELKAHEEFIAKNRANAATARMAQSRVKVVEKMELIELPPEPPANVRLRFPEPGKSGQVVFRLEHVAKRYGDLTVFSDVTLDLQAGTRLAVTGVNGAGKTTLLRLLAGREEPSEGALTLGHGVKLQYFSQYTDDVDPDDGRTLLELVQASAPPQPPVPLRTLLGCFLFSGNDVFKTVRVLSGGERARLKIARMILQPGNVLVMDEPTNHLDIHSQEVLLRALQGFGGTVIFVSHDRQFVRELATAVLHIEAGRVTYYPCDYEQYRWRRAQDTKV
ncbi:MAG: ATP-binding cassette domain-containing protein [Planctomycetes bacterium]|nr:ATP-binding cassette domain-containing protein [Planctomycetota bacterium]